MALDLGKRIWTDADFGVMSWHDAIIHAMAIDQDRFELMFDIDFILAWVSPAGEAAGFTFWVSPATLVFEDVQDLSVQLEVPHIQYVEVFHLHRQPLGERERSGRDDWLWRFDLQCGVISFRAVGFSQYLRKAPVHMADQHFSVEGRGGISFARG